MSLPIDRRNRSVKWPLLALLCLIALLTALALVLDVPFLYYLAPLGFLQIFLLSWFDARWLLIVLSLLPLLGWWLLHRGKRSGKWIIVSALWLFLAADVIVFVLHFITTLGIRSGAAFQDTVLLALACPVLCIPSLALTHKWYPHIS